MVLPSGPFLVCDGQRLPPKWKAGCLGPAREKKKRKAQAECMSVLIFLKGACGESLIKPSIFVNDWNEGFHTPFLFTSRTLTTLVSNANWVLQCR
jgi:hypothetical protein